MRQIKKKKKLKETLTQQCVTNLCFIFILCNVQIIYLLEIETVIIVLCKKQ